jgi:hypothetical protein
MVLKGKRPPPKRLRCLGGGNKPFLRLEIERDLVDKILKLREKGEAVTCDMVRIWALKLAQQPDFHASDGWLQRFLKRWRLSLHIPTQRKLLKLTLEELKTQTIKFFGIISQFRKSLRNPMTLNLIGNMDEIAIFYEMLP